MSLCNGHHIQALCRKANLNFVWRKLDNIEASAFASSFICLLCTSSAELVDVIITKCLPQTPIVICIMCMFEIYISIQVTKKSKGMGPVDYDPNVIIRECIIYGVTDAETTCNGNLEMS